MKPHPHKEKNYIVLFVLLISIAISAGLYGDLKRLYRRSRPIDPKLKMALFEEFHNNVIRIRSAVTSMVDRGIDINDIELCSGSSMSGKVCAPDLNSLCTNGKYCVFSAEGGGVDPQILRQWFYILSESDLGLVIAGHGSANILFAVSGFNNNGILFNLTLEECQKFQELYGLSTTIEKEQTGDSIIADGIPSLASQWDFCYDSSSVSTNYAVISILATTN